MFDLSERVAIVTGAEGGMGTEIARLFAAAGAAVVATDIQSSGEAVAAKIGERAIFVPHDVADEAAWNEVMHQARQAFGVPAVMVNAARYYLPEGILETTPESMDQHYRVNQRGPYLGMRAFAIARDGRRGGSIINVSSGAGLRGAPGRLAYVTTKWALRGMSRNAARDLAPQGIRVNCIFPGIIRTPMIQANTPEQNAALEQQTPLGRTGEPREPAELIAFLASDYSAFITGAEITVDGGILA